jgi:hypothetical protein
MFTLLQDLPGPDFQEQRRPCPSQLLPDVLCFLSYAGSRKGSSKSCGGLQELDVLEAAAGGG